MSAVESQPTPSFGGVRGRRRNRRRKAHIVAAAVGRKASRVLVADRRSIVAVGRSDHGAQFNSIEDFIWLPQNSFC